jgi:hypothetical protein
MPIGFRATDFDPRLTAHDILEGERTVDVALLCERITGFRRRAVDTFAAAFPQGVFRGPGWPQGFLPEADRIPLLQRTKVGMNMHNSTGPINFRTYYLPANGVLQLCDNKSHLGSIFELGTEVVGYDSVSEAIDLCRYYLAHDEERRSIAAAGWQRAVRDYNEVEVFRRMDTAIASCRTTAERRAGSEMLLSVLESHSRTTRTRRVISLPARPVQWLAGQARRVVMGLVRRVGLYRANVMLRVRGVSR